jgi:hypothetical protein
LKRRFSVLDDVERMKIFQCEGDLCKVEQGDIWGESLSTTELGEELAGRKVGEEHVDTVLEGGEEVGEKGMANTRKDVALCAPQFCDGLILLTVIRSPFPPRITYIVVFYYHVYCILSPHFVLVQSNFDYHLIYARRGSIP